MHVPDHFLNDATSASTAVAAAAVLAYAAYRVRKGEALAPPAPIFAAVTAAIFGLQMLNYPVADGTSGHLLGGALAAAVLGPFWGMFSVAVVLVIQGVVFADGGLTALGTNVILMAVIGVLVGWFISRSALTITSRRSGQKGVAAVGLAVAAGGFVSVVAAAAAFSGLYAIGGTVPVPLPDLASSMLSVHALIGIGEGLITAAVVAWVAVYAPGSLALTAGVGGEHGNARRAAGSFVAVAVAAAVGLSWAASSNPDGLEATAEAVGFATAARDHALAGLPLADYGDGLGLFVGLVGLVGIVLSVAAAIVVRRMLTPRVVDAVLAA